MLWVNSHKITLCDPVNSSMVFFIYSAGDGSELAFLFADVANTSYQSPLLISLIDLIMLALMFRPTMRLIPQHGWEVSEQPGDFNLGRKSLCGQICWEEKVFVITVN